ncbi:esterase, PHB depolymerase subfamily protein, partial [Acanthamoeba castellanii str. Neff]
WELQPALLRSSPFCGWLVLWGLPKPLFVPSRTDEASPLFVMLHGCTQNPTDFAAGTQMNVFAEKYNFYVLYPEQTSSANANKCWLWWEPTSQARNGDNKLIADMTAKVISSYNVSSSRVFVGGLSAGAAQSVLVAVAYPEVFAGLAVGAGLEWKAAESVIGAYTAMSSGGPSPAKQGAGAYAQEGAQARVQKVLVIHGTSDSTVQSVNGKQVVSQYATTLDYVLGKGKSLGYLTDVPTATTKGQVTGGRAYTLFEYADTAPESGQVLIKFLEVTGMGHAWSGGSSSGTYADPKGPDARHHLPLVLALQRQHDDHHRHYFHHQRYHDDLYHLDDLDHWRLDHWRIDHLDHHQHDRWRRRRESGFVGQLVADGYGSSVAKVGDKGFYNTDTYRTILSSLTGAVGQISIDVKQGYFGNSDSLEQGDYSASASATGVATLSVPNSDGEYSEVVLPPSALSLINSQGGQPGARTQFRLRAATTASFYANLLEIDAGDAASPSNDAALIVKYHRTSTSEEGFGSYL